LRIATREPVTSMSHVHSCLHVHLVWSVKDRARLLTPEVWGWLAGAMSTKARALGCRHGVVGGVDDHIHVLADLPPTLAVSELVRQIKGATSYIAHSKGAALSWQPGYGAFAVSKDDVAAVDAYVRGQVAHHADRTLRVDLEPVPQGLLER
jgi:REP element-mobilizing transposase RayT